MTTWADGTSTTRTAAELETSVRSYANIRVGPTVVNAPTASGSDQSAALQAAWDSGDILQLGNGTYIMNSSITPNAAGKSIRGMGRARSELKKGADTILLNMSGTATDPTGASHCAFCKLSDFTLNGNNNASWTQPLIRAFYNNNNAWDRLYFKQNYGPGISATEWWDSQVSDCAMANVGGTGTSGSNAALLILRSQNTIGNFGYSAETNNMLTFKSLRIEAFRDGAVNIGLGTGSIGENQTIRFVDNCKFETINFRGKAFRANGVRALTVRDAYCWVGGFDSGYSSPDDFFYFTSLLDSTLDTIFIGEGGSYLFNAFRFDGGNYYNTLSNVSMRDFGDMTGAIARFRNGNNNIRVSNVVYSLNTGASPVFDGCPDVPWHLSGSGTAPGTSTILSGAGGASQALAGAIGSTFTSTDGGASTTLYVKESGAGATTGWVAK